MLSDQKPTCSKDHHTQPEPHNPCDLCTNISGCSVETDKLILKLDRKARSAKVAQDNLEEDMTLLDVSIHRKLTRNEMGAIWTMTVQ